VGGGEKKLMTEGYRSPAVRAHEDNREREIEEKGEELTRN